MSVWTRCLTLIGAIIIALAIGRPGFGPDQAEMGACLRDHRALPHRGAVGGRRDQEAHQRQISTLRCFRLPSSATRTSSMKALGLGTVDIVYVGINFVAATYKPLGITGAPFMLRDLDHWKAYRDSKLFADLVKGYDDKTRHKIVALTYYGQRHVTANKRISKPEDMKGMKLRVPPAPLFLMFTKSVGANATPIAFSEVYHALQQGIGRRPGKSAADDHGQEVLRGAEPHRADRPHHGIDGDGDRQSRLEQADAGRAEDLCGYAEGSRRRRRRKRSRRPRGFWPASSGSSARPWSSLIARRSARRRSRCTTMPPPAPAGPRRNTTSCRR